MNRFRTLRFLTMAVALALGAVWTPYSTRVLAQATTSTTSVTIPLPQPFQWFVPCAAGGAGEFVDLSGPLHLLFHTTLDGNGGFQGTRHANPQGVTGVGLTTGDVYRGTGMTRVPIGGTVGETYMAIDNFRLIGPGVGNNFLMHQTLHVTVNANGVVTAYVAKVSVECR